MAEFVWNQQNLSEQIQRLKQNRSKLQGNLDEYEKQREVVKRNWSGDEFEKADVKMIEAIKTCRDTIDQLDQQIKYLENKNNNFSEIVSGL